jgi:hypothetical protein
MVGGQVFRESSKSEKYGDAERLLKQRIGEGASGSFQGLRVERVTVGELLDDVLLDYRVNEKVIRFPKSAIENHLRPYFLGRAAVAVTTATRRLTASWRC